MGQAQRSKAITNGVGINVHLPGGQGNAYSEVSIATIISDCNYLGTTVVRDNIPDPTQLSASVIARYAAVASAGLKFDFCVGSSSSNLTTLISNLDLFATTNPGAIRFVEGPNEINYNPFSYKNLAGQDAAVLFQSDLKNAVRLDPLLAGVKVIDFTGGGAMLGSGQSPEPITGVADLAATHIYPALGDPPAWYVSTTYQVQYGTSIGAPYVVTEAGYNSDPGTGNGVSLDVQAKQTLMLLLDTAQSGATATMLYELLDMYADPRNKVYDDHWGLFDASGAPTPTAAGIHNMQAILSDPGATSTTFTPDSIDYKLSNMPPAGHDWLLEKSSGVFDLALWSEVPIWDWATQTQVVNPGSSVTINLGRTYDFIDVYDPLVSSSAVVHVLKASQVTLNLADDPLVVQFGFYPKASSTVTLQPVIKIVTGMRDGGVTLAGSSAANSVVTVSDNVGGVTTVLGTVTASSTGAWSLTSHTPVQTAAINSFTVSAHDAVGHTGSMAGQFLLASTGVDTLTGTTWAADVFAIMSFKGSDIIKGFETSAAAGSVHDVIDFSGRGISSFAQLQPMISSGSSAVISIGSGKTVTLSDVAASTLTAADFRFS